MEEFNAPEGLCAKCKREFKDGDILIQIKDKFYHHTFAGLSSPLKVISPCSITAINGYGEIGVFYKDNFYINLEEGLIENSKDIREINVNFNEITNGKGIVYGHNIKGDLSFLEKIVNY